MQSNNNLIKNRVKDAMVELTIPLDYFKDISLFFLKRCIGFIFRILGSI